MPIKLSLIALFVLAVLGLGLLLLWEPEVQRPEIDHAGPTAPTLTESQEAEPAVQPLAPPPAVQRTTQAELDDTTVLWPVEIALDLVEPAYLPTLGRGQRIGGGRTARMSGRFASARGEGVRASVHFVAGPNTGIVLPADVTGRFGSNTLHPGLSIVEVRGDGVLARREVRLRQGQDALLNIGFGRPSGMFGRVIDGEGNGVGGAKVFVDGHSAHTDDQGEFLVNGVAGGSVLLEIECAGFASHREIVHLTSGKVVPRDKLTFVLRPAASLRITITDRAGGPGPVEICLLPSEAGTQLRRAASFPWYRLGPIRMEPGSSRVIDGLPGQPLKLLAFRPGATAPQKLVHLRPGELSEVSLPLRPAPRLSGRVTYRGKPMPGSLVRLQPPDQTRATAAYFAEPTFTLEHEVLPLLPVAQQEARTDVEGRFVFTAWNELSAVRYLEARGPEGKLFAGRLVRGAEEHLELELEEVDFANSTLEIAFPDRWQGLPVELTINGGTLDPLVVPPHEPLVLNDLLAGRWSIRASWYAEPIQQEEVFELDGFAERVLRLPQEAIDGQDEEAWARAGREFPYQ